MKVNFNKINPLNHIEATFWSKIFDIYCHTLKPSLKAQDKFELRRAELKSKQTITFTILSANV